jgi:hypothetical protein
LPAEAGCGIGGIAPRPESGLWHAPCFFLWPYGMTDDRFEMKSADQMIQNEFRGRGDQS